jgi:hypothetical protein
VAPLALRQATMVIDFALDKQRREGEENELNDCARAGKNSKSVQPVKEQHTHGNTHY